jgi:hypothetical protein
MIPPDQVRDDDLQEVNIDQLSIDTERIRA